MHWAEVCFLSSFPPFFLKKKKRVLSYQADNCSLAYAEARLILAHMVFNFDMELDERCDNWSDQTIYMFWNKPDLLVTLYPRTDCNQGAGVDQV